MTDDTKLVLLMFSPRNIAGFISCFFRMQPAFPARGWLLFQTLSMCCPRLKKEDKKECLRRLRKMALSILKNGTGNF